MKVALSLMGVIYDLFRYLRLVLGLAYPIFQKR